jgi:hypothetical protein
MRVWICLLVIAAVSGSCKDAVGLSKDEVLGDLSIGQFKSIDPATFRNDIKNRTDIENAHDLLLAYTNNDPKENDGLSFKYKSAKSLTGNQIVMLQKTGLKDDSLKGVSILMECSHNIATNKWTIHEIYESYQCYKGRGHEEWSSEPCL